MRFNLFLCAVIVGVEVYASTPLDFFNQNREDVLSEKCVSGGGLFFGVGRARVLLTSSTGKVNARNKAKLLAMDSLIRNNSFCNVAWPTQLDLRTRDVIQAAYRKQMTITAQLKNVQTVYETLQEGEAIVVVAAPFEVISGLPQVTFTDIYQTLVTERTLFSGLLSVEDLVALRSTQEQLPPTVDRTPWEQVLNKALFATPRLARLPQFAGRYPIGQSARPVGEAYARGQRAYNAGALQEAYTAFIEEVELTFSYDALNMAGNVARRIGKWEEAIPLLLHAAYLNPDSPHPWVHLAFVAHSLERPELVKQYCQAARSRNPDQWTLQQIEKLHM